MYWIMKLPLILSTYDPLSITQMCTTLSSIDHIPLSPPFSPPSRLSFFILLAHLHRSADGYRGG